MAELEPRNNLPPVENPAAESPYYTVMRGKLRPFRGQLYEVRGINDRFTEVYPEGEHMPTGVLTRSRSEAEREAVKLRVARFPTIHYILGKIDEKEYAKIKEGNADNSETINEQLDLPRSRYVNTLGFLNENSSRISSTSFTTNNLYLYDLRKKCHAEFISASH